MYYGGVFEQLARYTMGYQESDLHFGLTDRGNKIKLNSVWVMFWAEPTWLRSARSYNDIRLLSAMTLQTPVTQTDCERPLCSSHLQC